MFDNFAILGHYKISSPVSHPGVERSMKSERCYKDNA